MDTRSWNEKTVKSSVTETEIKSYCQSQITILKNSSKRTSQYKIELAEEVRSYVQGVSIWWMYYASLSYKFEMAVQYEPI